MFLVLEVEPVAVFDPGQTALDAFVQLDGQDQVAQEGELDPLNGGEVAAEQLVYSALGQTDLCVRKADLPRALNICSEMDQVRFMSLRAKK